MQGRERKIPQTAIILFCTDNQGRERQSKVESLVWYPDPLKSGIDLSWESWRKLRAYRLKELELCWIPFAANGLDGAHRVRQSKEVSELCGVIVYLVISQEEEYGPRGNTDVGQGSEEISASPLHVLCSLFCFFHGEKCYHWLLSEFSSQSCGAQPCEI